MKYESNTPMYSKDIARKPFFVRTGQDVRDVRMDKGDAICPPPLPHYKWRCIKKYSCLKPPMIFLFSNFLVLTNFLVRKQSIFVVASDEKTKQLIKLKH